MDTASIIMLALLVILICLTLGILIYFSRRLGEQKRTAGLAQGQIQQLLGEVQRFQERSEGLRSSIDGIQRDFLEELARSRKAVSALQDNLNQGSGIQEHIKNDLTEAKTALLRIREENEEKSSAGEQIIKSLSTLEHLMRDSSMAGISGENILYQALSSFPREMIEINTRINDKIVELALKMPGGKLLPIHSKFREADLQTGLESGPEGDDRKSLIMKAEQSVGILIREVSGCIDTNRTEPMAILALPDSIYSVLEKAHFDAFRHNVVLMSYSLSVPYLLTLLNLHRQMAGRASSREVAGQLARSGIIVDRIGQVLDNQMVKAVTQLSNAHQSIRGLAGDLKAIISQVDTGDGSPNSKLGEGGDTPDSWAVPEK